MFLELFNKEMDGKHEWKENERERNSWRKKKSMQRARARERERAFVCANTNCSSESLFLYQDLFPILMSLVRSRALSMKSDGGIILKTSALAANLIVA